MLNRALKYRSILVPCMQGGLFVAAFVLSFLVRFDFAVPPQYWGICMLFLPLNVAIKYAAFYYFKMHMGLWRYFSFRDLNRLVKATLWSSIIFLGCVILLGGRGFPRSIYLLDGIFTLMFMGGFRVLVRIFREGVLNDKRHGVDATRILIVGAGDAGDMAARMIEQEMKGGCVVGFLDDSPGKRGLTIRGYPILGTTDDAYRIAKEKKATQILFAIRDVPKSLVRHVVDQCTVLRLRYQILPVFRDVITGEIEVDRIRAIQVEDLLGREPIQMDRTIVRNELNGQTVMVTGAGGSIGSELVRQIVSFKPCRLIMLDMAESALFEIEREIKAVVPNGIELIPFLGNILDESVMRWVMKEYTPAYIYHAAAYKHVPLLESHPLRGMETNIFGTRKLAELACEFKVKRFVMISTDKAVRPTSIMGATKRCTEMIVTSMPSDVTRFTVVRFGNVLGSNGSVVPIFKKQIANGGPLTVTHPEMTRFFMTIPEAVELVLQAGSMGDGGEVFILDMGKPVKIVDLARKMLELSGKIEDADISIIYTGIRPGEKMYEELTAYGEDIELTANEKIRVHRRVGITDRGMLFRQIDELAGCVYRGDENQAKNLLWSIISSRDEDVKSGR